MVVKLEGVARRVLHGLFRTKFNQHYVEVVRILKFIYSFREKYMYVAPKNQY